ncbi:RNA-binding S4 domain-containing protein [Mariniphaga sediminis]|uniref:RNA-binding S4 domain-containing protein n=1 Tax=Mariniphaga sediminis TaxID=1628158 RepID=A0A399D5B2_9BACT|nr:RNA-binding S4 domain-containing protein [Mariniphaga sediminis]RIH65620.1 RNA-binding S4 domain-containing protein [Mariniphaga sediminis]
MREFTLHTEYIELVKLLKLLRIAETGGHAKILVDEGRVLVNGNTESRKRAKLRPGDEIETEGDKIIIRGAP